MNYLKPVLLIAMAAASAGVSAQQSYPPQQQSTGEVIIQQILDQVVGRRYTSDDRYRNAQEQEVFRRADTNRDGILTRQEVDAYRARMGYEHQDNRYQDNRRQDWRHDRGIPVSQVDVNHDGYISRAEAANFVRQINRHGLDDYYDRSNRGRSRR